MLIYLCNALYKNEKASKLAYKRTRSTSCEAVLCLHYIQHVHLFEIKSEECFCIMYRSGLAHVAICYKAN